MSLISSSFPPPPAHFRLKRLFRRPCKFRARKRARCRSLCLHHCFNGISSISVRADSRHLRWMLNVVGCIAANAKTEGLLRKSGSEKKTREIIRMLETDISGPNFEALVQDGVRPFFFFLCVLLTFLIPLRIFLTPQSRSITKTHSV